MRRPRALPPAPAPAHRLIDLYSPAETRTWIETPLVRRALARDFDGAHEPAGSGFNNIHTGDCCAIGNAEFAEPIVRARIQTTKEKTVMRWQAWKESVVGVFASLSLIGFAGASMASNENVSQSEPYFEVTPKAGEAFAATASQSEPYFEVAPKADEASAAVASQSEPSFDVKTEADESVATTAPQSERPLGLRAVVPQGKH